MNMFSIQEDCSQANRITMILSDSSKISSSPKVPKALTLVNYSGESTLKAEQQPHVR